MAAELRLAGFQVTEASDAFACRAALLQARPDVVLIDLGLPGVTGLELTRELRQTPNLALITVTRRDEPATVIEALEAGCDDYVIKPVHAGVLAARIRSVLRRRGSSSRRFLRLGPWEVDLEGGGVVSADGPVSVTRGEFALLRELIHADGKIVSRENLLRVISRSPDADGRSVDTLVSRLRRKLPLEPGAPELIVAAPGFGYRLSLVPSRQPSEPPSS